MTHRIVFTRLTPGTASASTLALAIAGTIPSAFALSLGGEQVTSSLGQPLRMIIPLLGSTADSLDTRCYRLVNPLRSDGLSVITQARIELQNGTNPPQLIIRSSRLMDEPVVRVSIEAGCDAPIRRDYTILLDPPPAQAPEPRVAVAAPPPALPMAAERPPILTSAADMYVADRATVAAERAVLRRTALAAFARSALKPPSTTKVVSRDKSSPAKASRDTSTPARATAKQIQQDKLEVQGGAPPGLRRLPKSLRFLRWQCRVCVLPVTSCSSNNPVINPLLRRSTNCRPQLPKIVAPA